MAIVNFIKDDINIEVKENSTLLDVIREAKLKIGTPCNGMGSCGKCKVIVRGTLSVPSDVEKRIIDEKKG